MMEPIGVPEVQYILTLFALGMFAAFAVMSVFASFVAAWLVVAWIGGWNE